MHISDILFGTEKDNSEQDAHGHCLHRASHTGLCVDIKYADDALCFNRNEAFVSALTNTHKLLLKRLLTPTPLGWLSGWV